MAQEGNAKSSQGAVNAAAPWLTPEQAQVVAPEHRTIKLSSAAKHDLLNRAQRCGETDRSILVLRDRLSSPTLRVCDLAEIQAYVAHLESERTKRTKTYFVRDECAFYYGGKHYKSADAVQLAPEDLPEFEELVQEQRPSKKQAKTAARGAGKYRVARGSVVYGGKFHGVGSVLDLDTENARSLTDQIELVA